MSIKKRMELGFIKNSIKLMNKQQIEGLLNVVSAYPDTDEDKKIIMEFIQETCKKKGYTDLVT